MTWCDLIWCNITWHTATWSTLNSREGQTGAPVAHCKRQLRRPTNSSSNTKRYSYFRSILTYLIGIPWRLSLSQTWWSAICHMKDCNILSTRSLECASYFGGQKPRIHTCFGSPMCVYTAMNLWASLTNAWRNSSNWHRYCKPLLVRCNYYTWLNKHSFRKSISCLAKY